MTQRREMNAVATSAQRWLEEQKEINDLEFRAQILESEASGLEAEATKARKEKVKTAEKADQELQDLKVREKEIKAGDQMADATKRITDLRETTGLKETEDARKYRQTEIKATVEEDTEIQDLLERAGERRLRAQELAGQAADRKAEAENAGAAIIESVANLGRDSLL